MSLQAYLAFVAACIALALLPGPVVTLVIANGLRHGTRAALINIAGAQAGLPIVIGIVAVGLTSLMATMGYWFDWVRFAGAAYLVWLGIKLIRSPVEGVNADEPPPPPRGGFFLQGFLVLLSNPKVLVFFGAFIPQFMDMSKRSFLAGGAARRHLHGDRGASTDAIYALLAGRARLFFSAQRTRLLSRISGGFMIGGGIWLALTRAQLNPQARVEPVAAAARLIASRLWGNKPVPDLPWFVYAMLLAPLGLLLGAAVYKTLQVRAAREWPSTAGKVVVSKAEVRKVRVIDSDREEGHRIEERNFADIVYEYSVAGRKLRNNRVSIGEDLGNFQVAETIAKYPVGAIVTVYYNPLHPNEAVLERDLPKGLWGCLGIGTAIVLAIVFGSAIGLHQITEFVVDAISRNPKMSPLVVAFGAFGFVDRAVRAGAAAAGVAGEEMAGRDRAPSSCRASRNTVPRRPDGGSARGRSCTSARCPTPTATTTSPTPACTPASRATSPRPRAGWCANPRTAYQDGASVKVWVNPANPSEATLEPRASVRLGAVVRQSRRSAGVAYYAAVHG